MLFNRRKSKQQSELVVTGDSTGPHRSDQVDTGSALVSRDAGTDPDHCDHQSAAIGTGSAQGRTDPPLIFGALRSPKEHAAKLVEFLPKEFHGRAIHQGQLEEFHWRMCQQLGWLWRKWPSVGREIKKLPGVRKGKIWFGGERLTVYEFGPPCEAEAVVDLASAAENRRKCAR